MSFYEERILPRIVDRACSAGQVMKLRSQVVPHARGVVLEVGMGPGINLELYDPSQVSLVYGLEPSEGMRRRAEPKLKAAEVRVEWLGLPGEQIPLPDESVDTVLLTFTLCTIPDFRAALAQMRRVLRPSGELLFLEHGESPEASVRDWQRRLNSGWKKIAGGCNLDRPIPRLLADAGFEIIELESAYVPKTMKIAGFVYKGRARKADPAP
jgi:ubiquinone/menaquinone biosynthesis C-methylase UbiE